MATTDSKGQSIDFRILCHHIYEYHKGVRHLILHTMAAEEREPVERFLTQRNMEFCIRQVSARKINVFFGNPQCVAIVRGFGATALNKLSDEQDFMLGVMLGYDRMAQCARYLKRKALCNSPEKEDLVEERE